MRRKSAKAKNNPELNPTVEETGTQGWKGQCEHQIQFLEITGSM